MACSGSCGYAPRQGDVSGYQRLASLRLPVGLHQIERPGNGVAAFGAAGMLSAVAAEFRLVDQPSQRSGHRFGLIARPGQRQSGAEPPQSPDVWELSRFCAVDLNEGCKAGGQFSSPIALQLFDSAVVCAEAQGAKRLIRVSPLGIERLLRRAGFHAHRAGPPIIVEGHPLFACLIEVDRR